MRRRWPPQTLRSRLTLGLVAILLLACAILGLASAFFLRSFLLVRLDSQLTAAGGRYSASLEHPQVGAERDGGAGAAQSPGTVGVRLVGGVVTQAAMVTDDGTNRMLVLDDADLRPLRQMKPGAEPSSHRLNTIGDYRLQAVNGIDGDVLITGLPLRPVDDTLARLVAVDAGLFATIVFVGAVATALVVRRTLLPLEHVTATALHVSELPLTAADTVLPTSIAPAEPTSEVDQVRVAFDHMLDHIRQALSARDATEAQLRRFIADASHELRTPLATIRAYAEFAGRAGPEPIPDRTTDGLARITLAADRMGGLVSDLLLLARLDAGRPLAREAVDVTCLVLDAVADARAAAPDHEWRLDLPERIITAVGDKERLHQVVANLLTNSWTHTPPRTTVLVVVRADDAEVDLRVVDDGPGIAGDQQATLFDRFTRGDDSRSRAHGSTGLGLAIAHGIARAHHGDLTVTSTVGQGSAFRLRLPVGTVAERN